LVDKFLDGSQSSRIMSSVTACVICGMPTPTEEPERASSWLDLCRTGLIILVFSETHFLTLLVYTVYNHWGSARLSGGGNIRSIPQFPINSSWRYDDPRLSENQLIPIYLGSRFFRPNDTNGFSEFDELLHLAWGFPLHESCWLIFQQANHSLNLNIQDLLTVLRSFPGQGALDMGHDYGVLSYRRNINEFAIFQEPSYDLRVSPEDSGYCDPDHIPSFSFLERIGTNLAKKCKDSQPLHVSKSRLETFAVLPTEILQIIITHLPSKSVLNLRIASRVFAEVYLPRSFWASRFYPDFEFDFLQKCYDTSSPDWRMVYLGLRSMSKNKHIVNRRRIWELSKNLGRLMTAVSPCHGQPSWSLFEPDAPKVYENLISTGGEICSPLAMFYRGSISMYERFEEISSTCRKFKVYFINVNNVQYISGIEYQSTSSEQTMLGYCHTEQSFINLSHFPGEIIALQLAMDPRGLRALAVVLDNGKVSDWAGDINHTAKSEIALTLQNGSFRVLCGFDVGRHIFWY
jgi:hypothetical protein